MLVAPASRAHAVIGRSLGDSFASKLQESLITLLIYAVAPLNLAGILPSLAVCFLTPLAFDNLGIPIASRTGSPEGFQLVANLLMFLLMFLSELSTL